MGGHGEKGIAFFILLLIGIYLLFRKSFAVSTSVNGVQTPTSAKTFDMTNIASFNAVPDNAPAIVPYSPSTPPDVSGSGPGAGSSSIGSAPFPLAYSTSDQSGLSVEDHNMIESQTIHSSLSV